MGAAEENDGSDGVLIGGFSAPYVLYREGEYIIAVRQTISFDFYLR